ncbi:hypothetical protein JXL19_02835 [bacterium]|nr:hypothetical protein [bacterium]
MTSHDLCKIKSLFILALSIVIFSSFLFSPQNGLSQEITSQIALKGAMYYAQEVFGTLICIDDQLLVDMDDNLHAYVFTLCHPDSLLPDLDAIRDLVSAGQLADIEKSGFVTVLAGANKSHTPVIQMYRGLPDFLLNQNKIEGMLEGLTGLKGWAAVRYLYPAPFECWLELRSPISEEVFFVRAADMKMIPECQMMDLYGNINGNGIRARGIDLDLDRAERIKKKWQAVEAMHVRLEKGSQQMDMWEPDNTPQEAKAIIPNGPSQYHTLTQQADKDWVSFFAVENKTYQIFTRPNNPSYPVDTEIFLYNQDVLFNPDSVYIAYNDDFGKDYSSLINWVCPLSGYYYLLVKNYNPDIYGTRESYTIQVTSYDLQDDGTIISGVPDYSQSDFGDPGNCAPVAAACVLGYWDSQGYDRLVDSDKGVAGLINELQNAMDYPSIDSQTGGVRDEDVPVGIERVCNHSAYGNNYNFRAQLTYYPDFEVIINEITYKRPVLYGIMGHSVWEDHWMTTVGYLETETTLWVINHDNWNTTPRHLYVDWDEATDCIVTVSPGKQADDNVYVNSNLQYSNPSLNTYMGTWPYIGFGLSPFSLINNPFGSSGLPLSWFYPGYTNLGNPGGIERFGSIGFLNQYPVLTGIQQPFFWPAGNNLGLMGNYQYMDFPFSYLNQYSYPPGGGFFASPYTSLFSPFFSNFRLFH